MAQTFDPIRVLRSFSLNLLREFILRHKGTPPAHGASVKRRNCRPLYDAWQSIPDEERAHMQLVLQKIHTLSQEHGMTPTGFTKQFRKLQIAFWSYATVRICHETGADVFTEFWSMPLHGVGIVKKTVVTFF